MRAAAIDEKKRKKYIIDIYLHRVRGKIIFFTGKVQVYLLQPGTLEYLIVPCEYSARTVDSNEHTPHSCFSPVPTTTTTVTV